MKSKSSLIESFKTTPIVQIACQKSGVSRSTYYRWRVEDKYFRKKADGAMKEGIHFINDLAESQLISLIKDKNLGAIIFWLKSHHSGYVENKISLSVQTQEALIKSLKLGDKDKFYKKLTAEAVEGNVSPINAKNLILAVGKTPQTALSLVSDMKAIQDAVAKLNE